MFKLNVFSTCHSVIQARVLPLAFNSRIKHFREDLTAKTEYNRVLILEYLYKLYVEYLFCELKKYFCSILQVFFLFLVCPFFCLCICLVDFQHIFLFVSFPIFSIITRTIFLRINCPSVLSNTSYIWQTWESHRCKFRLRTDMRTN